MEPVAHLKTGLISDDVVAVAERTEQALSRLPSNPEEIAEFLHGQHIRGTQFFSTSCPIANWLKRQVPELAASTSVAVTPLVAEVAHQVEVEIPPVVTDFIVAFDAGDYDFLVDEDPCGIGRDAAPSTPLDEFA